MKTIQGICLVLNKRTANGTMYTSESFKESMFIGLPIYSEYDHTKEIGRVDKVWIEGDYVKYIGMIEDESLDKINHGFFLGPEVVGDFCSDETYETITISNAIITSLGFTITHSQKEDLKKLGDN
jgi:hypothetical protein